MKVCRLPPDHLKARRPLTRSLLSSSPSDVVGSHESASDACRPTNRCRTNYPQPHPRMITIHVSSEISPAPATDPLAKRLLPHVREQQPPRPRLVSCHAPTLTNSSPCAGAACVRHVSSREGVVGHQPASRPARPATTIITSARNPPPALPALQHRTSRSRTPFRADTTPSGSYGLFLAVAVGRRRDGASLRAHHGRRDPGRPS